MRYPYDIRIIGGKNRSRKLALPENQEIRPTANRSREAIFNMLSHARNGQSIIYGARVLDVFSGTGALGLEALSRGADFATFVDNKAHYVRENVAALGEEKQSKILEINAKDMPKASEPCDIIFIDPPYDQNLIQPTLNTLLEKGWIAPRAVIVVESSMNEQIDLPAMMEEFDVRVYGKSKFRFLSYEPVAATRPARAADSKVA